MRDNKNSLEITVKGFKRRITWGLRFDMCALWWGAANSLLSRDYRWRSMSNSKEKNDYSGRSLTSTEVLDKEQ